MKGTWTLVMIAACHHVVRVGDGDDSVGDGDADADASGCPWTVTELDSDVQDMSIAAAPDGVIDIAYATSISEIRYASNRTGDWVIQTIDERGSPAGRPSLAVDAEGRAHVAYPAGGGYDDMKWDSVKYAVSDGEGFTTEVVAEGAYPSLALDSSGTPEIALFDYDELIYVGRRDAGGWSLDLVPLQGDTDRSIALALGSSGERHILFSEWESGDLGMVYATDASGDWEREALPGRTAQVNAIAVGRAQDGTQTIHVAYEADFEIEYGSGRLGDWTTELLPKPASVAATLPNLGLDDAGLPSVTFCDRDGGNFMYRGRSADGSWLEDTVPSGGCQWTSVVVVGDVVHAAWQCNGTHLCYAVRECPAGS